MKLRRAVASLVGTTAAIALLCSGSWLFAPAWAEGLDDNDIGPGGAAYAAKSDWDLTLGLGVADAPKYPGASAHHVEPVPIVSIKYRDFVFLGPEGLGINAIRWQGFRIGPTLGFAGGRKESDDPHLNGLGNIQKSATAGLFASYAIGHIAINASLRQAVIHAKKGLSGSLGASLHGPIVKGKLDFAAGPKIDFADGQYARTWFGVTPSQSQSSGLPVYTPSGGVKELGFDASL